MKSKRIINVLSMAKRFRCLPSEVIHLDDEYTAYCFDEACDIIMSRIDNGEEPVFRVKYNSFSEMYRQYA